MLSFRRPIDALFMALAALLTALAAVQWKENGDFAVAARQVDATVLEHRETRKQVLDAAADVYVRVEFRTEAGDVVRTDLPDPFRAGGPPIPAVGSALPVWYDPRAPSTARLASDAGRDGALVLIALAVGALFAPAMLRRALRDGGGGG